MTLKYVLRAAEKELEHQNFARKNAVFTGAEQALGGDFEGNVLDAADLKRYHDKVGKQLGGRGGGDGQREKIAKLLISVCQEAKDARSELILALRRSILRYITAKNDSIELLTTCPRAVKVCGEYEFQENLVKSRAENDLKRLQGKDWDLEEA